MYELPEFIRADNSVMRGARVIEMIETSSLVGNGTPTNPYRIRKEYWTKAGEILFPPANGNSEDLTHG